jgi:hypothetical protein
MSNPIRMRSVLRMILESRIRAAFLTCAVVFASTAFASAPMEQQPNGREGATLCRARGSVLRVDVDCPAATVAELLAALRAATGLQSEYPAELGSAAVSVLRRNAPQFDVLDGALSGFNFAVSTDPEAPNIQRVHILDIRGGRPDGAQTTPPLGSQIHAVTDDVTAAGVSNSAANTEADTASSRRPADIRGSGPHPANDEFEQQRVREEFEGSVVEGTPHPPPASEPGSVMVPSDSSQAESMSVTVTR